MAADIVNIKNLRKKIEEIESNGIQKVCVVGIVGKAHLHQKDLALNQLVDHNVFHKTCNETESDENTKQFEVKMFYDEEQKTVFLQLNSVHDSAQLLKACRGIPPNLSMAGRHHYWQDQLLQHAAALLFIFSVSHIVVVMFPTPRFDLSYLRLFKLLASSRYNMLHSLSQSLAAVDDIPEIWRTTGRPCIPRIIFSFQTPWSNAKGLNEHSLKKLQQSLQEQVHLILKKNRLLGSLSSSSLFTVSSPNQLFVHVQSPQKSHVDPIYFCINQVLKNSINMDMVYAANIGKKSQSSFVSQPSPTKAGSEDVFVSSKGDVSLRDFLYKQIDYMMTVESREVPAEGRRGTHVEAPNISLWYRVCEIVYEYFLGPSCDNNSHMKSLAKTLDLDWKFSENRCHKVSPMATNTYLDNLPSHYTQSLHLAQLSHCLHVFAMNARGPAYEHFANQLQDECNQVWWNGRHLCEAISMTGQPCVYPYHNIHDNKEESEEKTGIPVKSHSSRVTSVSACNCGRTQGTREDPFDLKAANCDFYCDLEKKCCSYLIHLYFPAFPYDDPSVQAKTTPSLQKRLKTHQITILGRKPKTPLSELSISSMPSQQPPEENVDASANETIHMTDDSNRVRTVSTSKNLTAASGTSLSFSGYQSTDMESRDEGASYFSEYEGMVQATKSMTIEAEAAEDETTDPETTPNTSTIDHFEGMITVNMRSDVLPLFPSWSLIILGSASQYNPLKGVEQIGFFSGSNYLLSWEIPVRASDVTGHSDHCDDLSITDVASQEEQWPAPGEVSKLATHASSNVASHLPLFQTMTQVHAQAYDLLQADKNVSTRVKRTLGSRETVSIKAYIGHEYECPRGHRFFCSAPDKMVKASGSGHVRENATKLVSANMPVYFPCPCRSSKPLHLAQITRTYVVTPDSAVTISLNPRVQPGECDVTPVFYTGINEGITLPPNSYCVLRFPYVYVDNNGPILPPAPSQPLLTCRLLRGMFSYAYPQHFDENTL